jgi:uncharacterized protein YhaN
VGAEIAQLKRERDAAQLELDETEREIATVTGERTRLGREVKGRIATLQLADDVGPDEIEGRLKELGKLATALEELASSHLRLSSSQTNWDSFIHRANELATKLGVTPPEPVDCPTFAATCHQSLAASKAAHLREAELRASIRTEEQGITAANANKNSATAILDQLAEIASCENPVKLSAAILASSQKRKIEAELSQLDSQLQVLAVDNVDRFLEEAASFDADELAKLLAETRASLAELEPRLQAARESAVQAQANVDRIDETSAAATAREEMEHVLAKMRRDAFQYARIRLAQALLARAIKSYQDRTQAPLLQHASRWLSTLTGGRYVKLVADYEGERQVVLSERADGTRLRNSELSDGTADPLYLALRLAAIQMRSSSEDPLPLVLDDVLLAFDEERVVYALQALASLAEKNQVILFTHHQHVVDLANRVLVPGTFATQTLAL